MEFGDLPPYDILRKLWKTFGIDAMASESLAKLLAKDGADAPSGGSGGLVGGGAQASMGGILIKGICRGCPGFVGAFGGSLGVGAAAVPAPGTLAPEPRWGARPGP